MNRDMAVGLYMLGLAFVAGWVAADVLARRRERERELERQVDHRFHHVAQAVQDLHGRIDAEKWMADHGALEAPTAPPAPA
ncbi:hypothetical protein CYFUS_001694 [Cystobacter fuscus]|uniref:Uncharacterized protein n=1 Tax=Cystobacter fuscus TaxID=43 RepID=A0A250IYE3_9BACT|nr:hypothetical protein [Cystobacter fuscus]ATB36280.1 hypothetical protein CYFUS_001694 [Cystobacter fuscus]